MLLLGILKHFLLSLSLSLSLLLSFLLLFTSFDIFLHFQVALVNSSMTIFNSCAMLLIWKMVLLIIKRMMIECSKANELFFFFFSSSHLLLQLIQQIFGTLEGVSSRLRTCQLAFCYFFCSSFTAFIHIVVDKE